MLDKKFEGSRNIYFEYEGKVSGVGGKEVRQQDGETVYGVKARDYAHACQIDSTLAATGKEYEVWG